MAVHEFDPLGVPEGFWSREQVRSALRIRDVGLLFRLLKRYAGASQTRIGVAVGLEQGYVSKVMNSRRSVTAIDLLDRIATGCNMPDESRMLFGLAPRGTLWQPSMASSNVTWQLGIASNNAVADDTMWPESTAVPSGANLAVHRFGVNPSDPDQDEPIATPDLATWTGVRLAYLIGVVDNWQGQSAQSDVLQTLLDQEIQLFDAITQENGHPSRAFSRRQAIATIAALPMVAAVSGATRNANAATESFLSRCAASLTACWHMLKGSDLFTISQVLSGYILELEAIGQRRSPHQQTAARLASQAHRICGIVALHRNQLKMREHHCKQALFYANVASDVSSQASALISLASTYFYDADPERAATVYEQALPLMSSLSPLHKSRIHAELSVVYGQLGRELDSLRSAELAERLYPEQPEQDPSFLYAEFTRASLTLERGMSYVALAEHDPDLNYQQVAAGIFADVEKASPGSVPDRIRYEIINHQARAAVLLRDLDAFEVYLSRSIDGVVVLGSKQRQKEIQAVWRRAIEAWPNERRLRATGERIRPALTGSRNSGSGAP